jgi:hypothetical protein
VTSEFMQSKVVKSKADIWGSGDRPTMPHFLNLGTLVVVMCG